MSAPKVVAKGADLIAQKIKKIATETGIPLVENVPLARTLFKTVKLGQTVPQALYQAVAEVLAYVYRLKNKKV
jgi:flagellar biosynthetic protein FlhB